MYDGLCRPCPEGTIYNSVAQVCVSQCQNNEIYSYTDKICICAIATYNISGTCVECGKNQIYNQTLKKCIDVCQAGNVYDLVINKCRIDCPLYWAYSYTLNTCIC
jgi:hypothetical protein